MNGGFVEHSLDDIALHQAILQVCLLWKFVHKYDTDISIP